VAYQGVSDDSVEATILKGQLMGIANLEFQSVAENVPLVRSAAQRR
jgi:hypothetical protein